jgi:hypothetical protein
VHRLAKEVMVVLLLAANGSVAVWWCMMLFGAATTGELLAFTSFLIGGVSVVVRQLNAGFMALTDLADYDLTTRENLGSTLNRIRRRMRYRVALVILLGVIALVAGVIVKNDTGAIGQPELAIGMIGGATLLASAALLGGQLLATSLIGQHVSALKQRRIALAENRRILASYELDHPGGEHRPT